MATRGRLHQTAIGLVCLPVPYLEQQAVYDQLDLKQAFDSPRNAPAAATVLQCCLSSVHGMQRGAGRGPCDYGGIYGERIQGKINHRKGS